MKIDFYFGKKCMENLDPPPPPPPKKKKIFKKNKANKANKAKNTSVGDDIVIEMDPIVIEMDPIQQPLNIVSLTPDAPDAPGDSSEDDDSNSEDIRPISRAKHRQRLNKQLDKVNLLQIQLEDQDRQIEKDKMHNNSYASTKSIGQGMLDMALLTTYLQLLASIIWGPRSRPITSIEITLLVFICLTIVLQITLLGLISMLYKTVGDKCNKCCSAIGTNYAITTITQFSAIATILISILAGYLTISGS
jgi:hypothetical protein